MSDVQLALLFQYIPGLILLFVYYVSGADQDDDDDNDGGKGIRIMEPAYAPAGA